MTAHSGTVRSGASHLDAMAAELSELEHSGRAAESLYVTQSAVSQAVRRLEAELGFLAAMFQEKIEAKLHAQFDAMLAS